MPPKTQSVTASPLSFSTRIAPDVALRAAAEFFLGKLPGGKVPEAPDPCPPLRSEIPSVRNTPGKHFYVPGALRVGPDSVPSVLKVRMYDGESIPGLSPGSTSVEMEVAADVPAHVDVEQARHAAFNRGSSDFAALTSVFEKAEELSERTRETSGTHGEIEM